MNNLENELLNTIPADMEDFIEKQRKLEIEMSSWPTVAKTITDLEKIHPDKHWDEHSIYIVYNRKQKNSSPVNGLVAHSLRNKENEYLVSFSHRIEYVKERPTQKKSKD